LIQAAVLGSPISHSLSPRLHNAAYKFLNISGTYSSFEVPVGALSKFLSDKSDSWTGFSLTMPLKEEALECVDYIDPLVQRIKSGNTIINQEGTWKLFSTDVQGFKNAWNIHSKINPASVLIIGSGATARAAAAAFDSPETRVQVVHRNSDREESMRNCIVDSSISFSPWEFTESLLTSDLVINTTPKFALDTFAAEVTSNPSGIFFDALYHPWPTAFAHSWSQRGGRVIGGIELLIAQGIEQIRLFTGKEIPTAELSKFLRDEFSI
jgi:shikimate dehydrogenase